MDYDYLYHSEHSAAVARFKALDLVSSWATDGRKIFPLLPNANEKDSMSCEFVTSKVKEQSCDMPRRVLFWEDDQVLSFVPVRDGYASYGGPQAFFGFVSIFLLSRPPPRCRVASLRRMNIVGRFLLGLLFPIS